MKIYDSQIHQIELVNFLRALNIAMMILDIPYIVWISLQAPDLLAMNMAIHAIILMPSIYYQFGIMMKDDEMLVVIPIVVGFFIIFFNFVSLLSFIFEKDPMERKINKDMYLSIGLPLTFIGGSYLLYLRQNSKLKTHAQAVVGYTGISIQEAMV